MPIGVIVNVSMVMPVSYLWSTYILLEMSKTH